MSVSFAEPMQNTNYYAAAELSGLWADYPYIKVIVTDRTTTGMTLTIVNTAAGEGTSNGNLVWMAIDK